MVQLSTLKAYIDLIRLPNLVIGLLSAGTGLWVARPITHMETALGLVCSVLLVMAGANALNDYYDIDIDRVNKPDRPLAQGILAEQTGVWIWLTTVLAAVIINLFLPRQALGIAGSIILLMWIYNKWGKRMPVLGNLMISVATASVFYYAALAGTHPFEAIIPAVFAFLFHFGREVLKDIEDMEGDRIRHAVTVPLRLGIPAALWMIRAAFLCVIVFSIYPYVWHTYGLLYFLLVLTGVDSILFIMLWQLNRNQESARCAVWSRRLKVVMCIGLAAIWLK